MLDSGATSHLVCDQSLFDSSRPVNQSVVCANGEKVKATRIGVILITNHYGEEIELRDVLYVPELCMNCCL